MLQAFYSMRQIIITLKIDLTENRGAIVSLHFNYRDKWVITLRLWIRVDKPFSPRMRATIWPWDTKCWRWPSLYTMNRPRVPWFEDAGDISNFLALPRLRYPVQQLSEKQWSLRGIPVMSLTVPWVLYPLYTHTHTHVTSHTKQATYRFCFSSWFSWEREKYVKQVVLKRTKSFSILSHMCTNLWGWEVSKLSSIPFLNLPFLFQKFPVRVLQVSVLWGREI